MYLDDFIETLTILRDHGRLLGSARVHVNGHEIEEIVTNGFDLELKVNSQWTLGVNPGAQKFSNANVGSHMRNTGAVRSDHIRRQNGED